MKSLRSAQHHKHEKGQSLVELAISMVILIMLLSGLLDLGRIWYVYVALEDAAGEAALFLSLRPQCRYNSDTDAIVNCADPNNASWRALNAVSDNILIKSRIHQPIAIDLPLDPTDLSKFIVSVGDRVTVRITYELDLLTPIIPRFTGLNPLIMTAEATQTIIRE